MYVFFRKLFGFTVNVIKYGCVTHCAFEYLGDFVVCSGPSMEPTLHTNNILLTERISPRLSKIYKGDIVIAICPTNPSQHICKRVTALPGDRVVATEPFSGRLIDDLNVKNVKIHTSIGRMLSFNRPTFETYVPKGQVWLEGDNSENSTDSRYYGPVPKGLIKSKVVCRLWPLEQFKVLL